MLETIQSIEDRFNHQYHYDWVFLNDVPFTQEFKDTVTPLISGQVKFGLISEEHWSYPDWIDQERVANSRMELKDQVVYGGVESYRHMCRWYSGFYQWHELLTNYKYYWRVEPEIKLFCDVDYDIFKYMRENKKKYGFIISIYEFKITIPTLFETILNFISHDSTVQPEIPKDNLKDFIIDKDGEYNLCHFWTNFEIADLDFFRSETYQKYFQYLDQAGGFFYDRWGDGPVRSIYTSLFLSKDEIFWIKDFGYTHPPYLQCPLDQTIRQDKKCSCDPGKDFTLNDYSCTGRYLKINGLDKGEYSSWNEVPYHLY
ncbi:Glycolipid 2-alpha-mannosyltransferase [Wickerhamomyces ciferrii]|uniref:Glycolipid 2-alpha-mannosyltransferase n=1 Tax=Wickerhamomyces ciferrii (strain ATCC 14091 / BCRC 22168 / CBS 111 / JCM 3599 / NBRC 0793 / NRRL Y-1031 F-60-10) TaxID=1206466 RepID=K0KKL4_WICCF|nr:Glycolipid 2-alpha-mannosyltransferase [Wickerhamomyces ciferrii]CCH42697.1 Glycolipid 2-alpha-mannosyltransferase [Wickerhamomyces ciferrii]